MPLRRLVITFVALVAVGALLGLGFAHLWADPARPHSCPAGAPASACQYPQVVHVGLGLTLGALVGFAVAALLVVLRGRSAYWAQ